MIVVDRLGNIQTNGESQNNFLKKLYGTFLGRCALKILVCRFVSNLGGWYMNSRFSKWQIKSFIEKNNIDMSQFENRQFTSYNDFFTRKILPGKRPYSKDDNVLISPADAKLSCYRIDDKCRVTIKDTSYSLEELLEDKELANEYLNGYWLVFRLTVDDYHRYHYIDDGKIIGNIMYTKAKLIDEGKNEKEILTFGPISILPEYQRQGYGKMLLEHSFKKAIELGFDTIVIFGSPSNYVSRGFKSCKKYNICLENGIFPSAMMVKELKESTLDGRKWFYYDSPVMNIDKKLAEEYDNTLEKMEKKFLPTQEEFYILSNSNLQ